MPSDWRRNRDWADVHASSSSKRSESALDLDSSMRLIVEQAPKYTSQAGAWKCLRPQQNRMTRMEEAKSYRVTMLPALVHLDPLGADSAAQNRTVRRNVKI